MLFIDRTLDRTSEHPDEYLTHELSTCVCACVDHFTGDCGCFALARTGSRVRLYVYFNLQLRCVDTHTHTCAHRSLHAAKCVELMCGGQRVIVNISHYLRARVRAASAALNQKRRITSPVRSVLFTDSCNLFFCIIMWWRQSKVISIKTRVRACVVTFFRASDGRTDDHTNADDTTRDCVAETTPSFYRLTNRRAC